MYKSFQYEIESLVVREFYTATNNPILKQAGMIGDMLGGIKNTIVDSFKEMWDPQHPILSVLEIVTPALLNYIPGPWSWVWFIASNVFGVNLSSLFSMIRSKLSGLFNSKPLNEVSSAEVSQIVQASVESQTQEPDQNQLGEFFSNLGAKSGLLGAVMGKEASLADDVKLIIAITNSYSEIKKFAEPKPSSFFGKDPKLFPGLGKILKFKFSGIFGHIIAFILNTILFTVTGAAVKSFVGNDKSSPESKPKSVVTQDNNGSNGAVEQSNFTATEYGLEFHKNDDYSEWIERGNKLSIKSTLIDWVTKTYPNLANQKSRLSGLSALNKVVNEIFEFNSDNELNGIIFIPKNYHTKRQIVDKIIKGL